MCSRSSGVVKPGEQNLPRQNAPHDEARTSLPRSTRTSGCPCRFLHAPSRSASLCLHSFLVTMRNKNPMKFIIFATKKTKKDFSQGNSELIVSLELVAEGSGRRRWERRQGRFSNRMHSRGHDLGLTRCRASPAEAASRSCLSLLLADLRGKLSFSFTSPF
jgi:hypothetical protein